MISSPQAHTDLAKVVYCRFLTWQRVLSTPDQSLRERELKASCTWFGHLLEDKTEIGDVVQLVECHVYQRMAWISPSWPTSDCVAPISNLSILQLREGGQKFTLVWELKSKANLSYLIPALPPLALKNSIGGEGYTGDILTGFYKDGLSPLQTLPILSILLGRVHWVKPKMNNTLRNTQKTIKARKQNKMNTHTHKQTDTHTPQ